MNYYRKLSLSLFLSTFVFGTSAMAEQPLLKVYKSPSCSCCGKWVDHLKDNGFQVETVNMNDLRMVKSMSGVTQQLASCHTAQVEGYVVEGHVPAQDIKRLLAERPDIRGLSAPGMPEGSPGMETGRSPPYQVLSFDAQGNTRVFAEH